VIISDMTMARLSRTPYGVMEDIPAWLLQPVAAQQPNAAPAEIEGQEVQEAQDQEPELPPLAMKDMHVLIVQDVSGSMESQRHSVATGINEIFGDLKKRYREPCEHKATVCVMQFSSHDHIKVGDVIPIGEVKPISTRDLVCDGMTAMWDAAAIAIEHMNTRSAGLPSTTYIFTDGDNNDSKIHTQSSVNEMIADNKKRNPMHSVLFIGSDPTTMRNARDIGLDRVHSIQHDSENTPVAYEVCRRALGRCVSGDTQSTEFNADDIVMSETPSGPRCSSPPVGLAPGVDLNDSQLDDDCYAFASDDVYSVVPQ